MFEIGVTFQPSLNIFSDNDRKLWTAQDNRGAKVGKIILETYCQKGNAFLNSVPIMIPPIPDSKYMDKLPQDIVLEGQTAAERELQKGYEAEVKVFRTLEEINGNYLVLHQLEFTHEQYSAFLPKHSCNKKRCSKGAEVHQCHQPSKNIEGENDFIVFGRHFAAVLEVKGLSFPSIPCSQDDWKARIKGCCEDALKQRKKIVDLIRSLDHSLAVFQFTVFSNISSEDIHEDYFVDETLLFSDDLDHLVAIINWCETISAITSRLKNEDRNKIKCCLGLWRINQENKWDVTKCSLAKSILDIDGKLRKALVTKQSLEEASADRPTGKNKGKKRHIPKKREYPVNAVMVDAPSLFKEYLDIRCLTTDQLCVFNSEERFLWVEGPAGSGKTIAMLGKIIHLALTILPEKKILMILPGNSSCPAAKRYLELLNSIRQDIKCKEITCESSRVHLNEDASGSSSQQLSACSNKIALLTVKKGLAKNPASLIARFDYVFVDDLQLLDDESFKYGKFDTKPADKNIISQGLLPIVRRCASHNTSIWISFDGAQSIHYTHSSSVGPKFDSNDEVIPDKYTVRYDIAEQLRAYIVNSKQLMLSVNLRNTFEISTVLSIIRKHCNDMIAGRDWKVDWPQQQRGHYLRGTIPVIYINRNKDTPTWKHILTKELEKLKGPESNFGNSDIAILLNSEEDEDDNSVHTPSIAETKRILRRFDPTNDQIKVLPINHCMSAEWPAVIFIHRYATSERGRVLTISEKAKRLRTRTSIMGNIPLPYVAMSRARVHSVVIINEYLPNICNAHDCRVFKELKERPDVCRIVEVGTEGPLKEEHIMKTYSCVRELPYHTGNHPRSQ